MMKFRHQMKYMVQKYSVRVKAGMKLRTLTYEIAYRTKRGFSPGRERDPPHPLVHAEPQVNSRLVRACQIAFDRRFWIEMFGLED